MSHSCGACDGTGDCHNEHHDLVSAMDPIAAAMGPNPCPACGQEPESPGNCSVCGGTGEQDDD